MPEGACDCDGNTYDCNGNCGGDDEFDVCNICNGPGIVAPYCDCIGHVNDCDDNCGGLNVYDECGVCGGIGIDWENDKCDC